jgi:OPA family sugar phosphate sensor protein UhpC-like MFS transporter
MLIARSDDHGALMRRYRIQAFVSTWCCYAGFYFCRQAFFVVKGDLTQKQGYDTTTLAYVGTAFFIAYTIGQFASAAIGSRLGARWLLLAGMGLSLFCNAVFGFANNTWTFLAFMILNGLAQGTGWSGNVGTMAQWFRREERGKVMGAWATSYLVGSAVAKGFTASLLGWFGWRWSFWGASAVLGGVWLLFYYLDHDKPEDVGLPAVEDPEPRTAQEAPSSSARAPASTGFTRELLVTILVMGAFYFFIKLIRYALMSWVAYFMQLNNGLTGDMAGYYSVLFEVFGFFGVLASGYVSDRFFQGRRTTVIVLMMLGLTGSTLMMWWVAGSAHFTLFIVALSLTGFMLYGPDALVSATGAIDVGSRRFALVAAAIINGMGSLGSVFQESVIGFLYNEHDPASLGRVFGFLGISAVLATGIMLYLAVRARQGRCNL